MSARLKTTVIKENSPEAGLIKRLYESSFPKIERIPFSYILGCAHTKDAELFAYTEGDTFVGFAFMLLPGNYAYLLFCATEPSLRSKGYGSAILKKLRRHYPNRAIVLDIEPLSDTAKNSVQRRRRYMFYYNNGFRDTGYEMRDVTGEYSILSDREGFDLRDFIKSYDILPEIFEGTEIYREGQEAPVFVPED